MTTKRCLYLMESIIESEYEKAQLSKKVYNEFLLKSISLQKIQKIKRTPKP